MDSQIRWATVRLLAPSHQMIYGKIFWRIPTRTYRCLFSYRLQIDFLLLVFRHSFSPPKAWEPTGDKEWDAFFADPVRKPVM